MIVSAGLHGAACSGLRGACCRFARCGTTRLHGVQVDSAQRKKLEICQTLIFEYAPDKVTLLQRRPPAARLNMHGEHITYDFTAELNVRPSMRGAYRGQPRPAWRLATARQRPSGRATALVRRWKLSLWLCRCRAVASRHAASRRCAGGRRRRPHSARQQGDEGHRPLLQVLSYVESAGSCQAGGRRCFRRLRLVGASDVRRQDVSDAAGPATEAQIRWPAHVLAPSAPQARRQNARRAPVRPLPREHRPAPSATALAACFDVARRRHGR